MDLSIRRDGRNGEAEDRPAVRVRTAPKLPAMRLDDGAANGETEPHSITLGRNERPKQRFSDTLSQAGSAVRNHDFDRLLIEQPRLHLEVASNAAGQGLE